jgi:site-specific DNA-methyltransferase (adenine-specific)/adenine-specific DNA-methyltransferase
MPTLNWIGKAAVVEHHKEVPFRLLKCRDDLSVGDPQAGNLLVQGDNLEALKALLPYYAEQVKCIYIDPPYNTGEESWVYNDKVDSPEMRDWLGNVVGGEAEDLSRHDKWLCMMYPRLRLLRDLMTDDGTFWMSIDDNEVHDGRMILDEIFGRQNFLATIVWQKRTSPESRLPLGAAHDYILVYSKNVERAKKGINRISLSSGRTSDYKNPDNDPRGVWASRDVTGQVGHATENQFYEIVTPSGVRYRPPTGRCWTISEQSFLKLVADNRIWFGKDGGSRPRMKLFLLESKGAMAWTWWTNSEVGHNQEATKEVKEIFGEGALFETPKPLRLIQRIIQLATNPGDLVLDSFAGSGTTGHAILKQNTDDSGNRRFILVEMDTTIASNITAERLKRVVQGYTYSDQKGNEKAEAGLGGGFRFCELGATLFDPTGQIRPEVKYEDLAQHIYFIETGFPLTPGPSPKGRGGLLGIHNGLAIYLLYNGVLKDKSPHGGNVLTYELLETLPPHDGPKVIYGNGCRIGEQRLRELNIVFKQIPYEIRER